ncbi:transposase [Cooperia oncophora]
MTKGKTHRKLTKSYVLFMVTKPQKNDSVKSDEERSGRPVEADDNLIKAIIDLDRHSTTREIAEKLHVNQLKQHQKLIIKKGLLSVWQDYKELSTLNLPPNRTINSDVYIEQLTKLNNAVEEKGPELTNRKGKVFHHDNARPHTSLATWPKLLELGWDALPLPPYSPDLAPSDYFLFRSLQNSLSGKNFSNNDDVKSHLIFFANKNRKFMDVGL